jgi:hypothetical protein
MNKLNWSFIAESPRRRYANTHEYNILEVHPSVHQHRSWYDYVCRLLSWTRRPAHAMGGTPDDHGGIYGSLRHVRVLVGSASNKRRLYDW